MVNIKRLGVMIDCSRDAVMKPEEVKNLVDYLALFGYNTLHLYTEETYEIEEEPYFGHLRGRYTQAELKDLDKYCKSKGVELIPCIQTLAHLDHMFRWKKYNDINDVDDVLFCGEEKTYELIEKMIKTCRDTFSTNYLHIGSDEAWILGAGNYFKKHGPSDRVQILATHLERVNQIVKKYGFTPIMWSDMFFRNSNKGSYYSYKPQLSEEAIKRVPEGMVLAYWDYYNTDYKLYDAMFKAHAKFDNETWFYGGAWSWAGFAPLNKFAMKTSAAAIKAFKMNNIQNYFVTMWGDDGKECSFYSLLPSLYAEKRMLDGITSKAQIKKEFFELTGESFDGLVSLDDLNFVEDKEIRQKNPSKYAFYDDPFLSIFESTIQGNQYDAYMALARKYHRFAKKSPKLGYLYEYLASFAKVMAYKYDLSLRTHNAYKAKDKKELEQLVIDYGKTIKLVKEFHLKFKTLWFKENKPEGWQVHDVRLGGLMLRLTTCKEILEAYLNKKIDKIDELEHETLDYEGNGRELGKKATWLECWRKNATINQI